MSSVLVSYGYPSSLLQKLTKTGKQNNSAEPANEFKAAVVLPYLNRLCLRLRSTTPMYWTKDHNLLLVRQMLTVDPYSQPKESREGAKLRKEIPLNLSAVSEPHFSVSVRSVRDHVNLVLINKHKRKVAEESKATGIAVDEPSEHKQKFEKLIREKQAAVSPVDTLYVDKANWVVNLLKKGLNFVITHANIPITDIIAKKTKGDAKKDTESIAQSITSALSTNDANRILEQIKTNTNESLTLPKTDISRSLKNLIEKNRRLPLSDAEKTLLKKGLNFAVTPTDIPATEIIAKVEAAVRKLDAEQADTVRRAVNGILQQAEPPEPNITKEIRDALKSLKEDESIKVLPADKRRASIVMDTDTYRAKMSTLITSSSTETRQTKLAKTGNPNNSAEPANEFKATAVLPYVKGLSERSRRCLQQQGGQRGNLYRLHPNNFNRDCGIEIPEAWMPTIKEHNNRRAVRQRTAEGANHRVKQQGSKSTKQSC
ncbi:hypothetical protein pdam_00024510 [Pocillopora damicornis]|uniref:Uncharacterized protein n=1 Tax=Pocillopora damicornis TaxID=46731 RepID=A0A3M6T961_POCDA|nr:hypothetical protein pdam_00024510 [Pocillopora damicornis]